jgi:hypothetical protein
MLDLITALGVAGKFFQFIDFGIKATSKAHEIHRSADGALQENINLEVLTDDLVVVANNFDERSITQSGNMALDASVNFVRSLRTSCRLRCRV